MRNKLILLTALLGALVSASPARAQTGSFVVVVHSSNPVSHLAPREVSRMFRKDVTRWDDGSAVLPVDLPGESRLRADFSQRVLGKPAQAMQAFWQQQIFSGRAVPPVERKSDAEVIEYVRTHPGAIGYVNAGTPLPSEVKTVALQ